MRKLLLPLSHEGIIIATLGKGGGVRLARPPDSITLRDIYLAVTEKKRLWVAREGIPCQCVASANIVQFFGCLAGEAEGLVLEMLANRTVADSVAQIRRLEMVRLDQRKPNALLHAHGT